MAPRPHHGRVAAAILGILSERGWLVGPYTVNLPRVLDGLRADGGVFLSREESVRWAMGFIEQTGGLDEGEDSTEILGMLATGYDDLRTRLGVDN
jgi:hypothetical protein